jgi:hypothetical protein
VGRVATDQQAAISVNHALGRLFSAQSPDLRVVLNWFGELEELASAR